MSAFGAHIVSDPALGFVPGRQLPHQAAIARGVGTAALGGAFGILTSLVAGGRTAREVIVPAIMGTVFWGGLIGVSVYFAYKEQHEAELRYGIRMRGE